MSARRRGLLGSLAAVVAGPAAVAEVVQVAPISDNPDAGLIRLCAEVVAAEDAFCAFLATRTTIEEEEATKDEEHRLSDLVSDLADQAIEVPATTLIGLAAKARATLHTGPRSSDGSPIINDQTDEMRVTVLEELIALAEREMPR